MKAETWVYIIAAGAVAYAGYRAFKATEPIGRAISNTAGYVAPIVQIAATPAYTPPQATVTAGHPAIIPASVNPLLDPLGIFNAGSKISAYLANTLAGWFA